MQFKEKSDLIFVLVPGHEAWFLYLCQWPWRCLIHLDGRHGGWRVSRRGTLLQLWRGKVRVSSAAQGGVSVRVIPLLRCSLGKSSRICRRGTALLRSLIRRDSHLWSRWCAVRGLWLGNMRWKGILPILRPRRKWKWSGRPGEGWWSNRWGSRCQGWLPDTSKWITAAGDLREIVESLRWIWAGRSLTQEAVLFTNICRIICKNKKITWVWEIQTS